MKNDHIVITLVTSIVIIGAAGFMFPMYTGDIVSGILIAAILAVIFGFIANWLLGSRLGIRPFRAKVAGARVALLLFIPIIGVHTWATFATAPMKKRFVDAAYMGNDNRLYIVVDERNRWLAERDFIYLGSWMKKSNDVSLGGLYLWLGPLCPK